MAEFPFLARVCWLFLSSLSPPLLRRSHLCWRQLLQVPVQPERGVFQRRVRPVPGDDRWENMTFDPSGDSLIHSLFFSFLFLLSFGWEGGRRNLVAHAISTDSVGEHQVKGGRRKEKHRLGNDDHLEVQRRGCRCFLCVSSTPKDCLWTEVGEGRGRMLDYPQTDY